MTLSLSILTTLEKPASHVAVETPIVKPALSSKYMLGKTAFYIPPKPFQKLESVHMGVFIQEHIRKL